MKPLLAVLLVASSLLAACADDTPPAEQVREHFERGASGQGSLGPIDRGDDPNVNPREGASNASRP
ncbi:MAG TPA: hypothetical protein VHW03_04035 [Chthoniobacterales bacterium]|nr:hypothetical protein [Chthoniobacterales bacterium]